MYTINIEFCGTISVAEIKLLLSSTKDLSEVYCVLTLIAGSVFDNTIVHDNSFSIEI